jgi:hypothetical protein
MDTADKFLTSVGEMFATATETESLERTAAQLAEFIAVEDEAVSRLKAELTERNENLDACKEQLATMLSQAGLKSIKLDSGLSPTVADKTQYYKAAGVDDDTLFHWLRGAGLGDIIKPTVHFGTLQSALKAFADAGGALPDTIINVSQRLTVRMNGKAKFLAARNAETPTA